MEDQLFTVQIFKILNNSLTYLIDLPHFKFIDPLWQIIFQQKNDPGKTKLKMLLILNTYQNLELL